MLTYIMIIRIEDMKKKKLTTKQLTILGLMIAVPVSYTHLDVYKRQVQHEARLVMTNRTGLIR